MCVTKNSTRSKGKGISPPAGDHIPSQSCLEQVLCASETAVYRSARASWFLAASPSSLFSSTWFTRRGLLLEVSTHVHLLKSPRP